MKVTVCFNNVRVVVPCGDGTLLVKDLMHEAVLRYNKATGKNDNEFGVSSLSTLTGGGLLDPDDRLCDVADDREQIVAHFVTDINHTVGDGTNSIDTDGPDVFPTFAGMKRESSKRFSMHILSTKEPDTMVNTFAAQSLSRESRHREPLGQDADIIDKDIKQIIIKNNIGSLGLHVVPCYDLLGNNQGLRVEGIDPNGLLAHDGQINLRDKIIKINGHNLLRAPYSKVEEILRLCGNEPYLELSVIKSAKNDDESLQKPQCTNYNTLQIANTRKIGRMIDIELIKGINGLGFSVTTRDNPAGGYCPIYIKNILPKGAAVEDGRLKPGDRLLQVNNEEVTGKSQTEVVALLRSTLSGGKVRLVVSRQEEISLENNHKRIEEVTTMTMEKKNRVILTLDIPVHDSEKAGLGISVKGKTSNTEDNSSMDLGIFIKNVIHGGAASRDGRLKNNDQLLHVNGVSLLGLSNSDAMETLRKAMLNTNSSITGVITLTIARRASNIKEDDNSLNFLSRLTTSPWNPVIDRLTEQYVKNSIRNESYCLATMNNIVKKMNDHCLYTDKDDSQHSGDLTYDSQLSLEESNGSNNQFSREALGRQSMSEKRHAALDAKNTDTYKRNKKLRENKEECSYGEAKKHWLVDQGFTTSRGDVKQASLNSALNDRYKRSRKKSGGIRSILRLGKNRKSLNFGDSIDKRHEPSNYCSGTINYIV